MNNALLSLFACVACSLSAAAAPGDLDPAFGCNGITNTTIGAADDVAACVAVQSDGKVVVAGYVYSGSYTDFAVARYLANGTLDATFNSVGYVTIPISGSWDAIAAVAIQGDGKIVVAGYAQVGANEDFALARLNTDGSLDTAFNGTGKVTTPISTSHERIAGVAIQSDGKIVAAGYARLSGIYRVALARYNANGTLDDSFDGDGKLTTAIGAVDDRAYAVALQPDGKIVVAGASDNGTDSDFALARYLSDGSLDASFGGDGTVTAAVGSAQDGATCVGVQSNGKIAAAGYTGVYGNYDIAVARFQSNGDRDTGFGGSGAVGIDFNSANDFASTLFLQGHNVLVAGYATSGGYKNFALVRYREDGSLDNSFGGDGTVETPIGTGNGVAAGVAYAEGGKIVAAGTAQIGGYSEFALARYEANSPPTLTLYGDNPLTFEAAAFYDDPGATASDFEYGSLVPRKQSSSVIPWQVGTYAVTYVVNDRDGLVGTATRVVHVRDTSGPLLHLPPGGTAPADAQVPDLAGLASATDNGQGPVSTVQSPTAGSTMAFTPEGVCTITVTATDSLGNSSVGVVTYTLRDYVVPGDMDPTFAGGGRVMTALADCDLEAAGMVLQNDGKIIVVGNAVQYVNGHNLPADFAVLRYNTDGTLDTSFNGTGIVTAGFPGGYAQGVAVQSDGRIVVSGNAYTNIYAHFAVARYNPDGSLDTTFNETGHVLTDVGYGDDFGRAVAIQSDGRIVVAGQADYDDWFASGGFGVARYTTDGSLDSSFNGTGLATESFGIWMSVLGQPYWQDLGSGANSVAVQHDGKIVAAGKGGGLSMVRWNTDGSLDGSFGEGGKVHITEIDDNLQARGLGFQRDGRLIVSCANDGSGNYPHWTPYNMGVFRFDTNGVMDATFGTARAQTPGYGDYGDYANGMAVQDDDKIVVTGTGPSSERGIWVSRYNADGSSDGGFNMGGKTSFYGTQGKAVVIQGDRKIVIAGTSSYYTNGFTRTQIVLIRLRNPVQSDMALERPSGVSLADGATNVLGLVAVGFPSVFTFAVKNRGDGDLTGLGIVIDGPQASEYSIASAPASPVAPNAGTAFSVRFSAATPGVRTATLHIASNDPDNHQFDINLTATCLSFHADTDSDGLSDASELQMAALGFDWQVNQSSQVTALFDNAGRAGLFTPAQVQDLNAGMYLLSRDPVTGECLLTIGVQKSTDLLHFDPLPITAPQLGVNGQGQIEFRFQATNSAAFFRLQSR